MESYPIGAPGETTGAAVRSHKVRVLFRPWWSSSLRITRDSGAAVMASLALAEGCLSLWFKEVNQGGDICIQLQSNVCWLAGWKSINGDFA